MKSSLRLALTSICFALAACETTIVDVELLPLSDRGKAKLTHYLSSLRMHKAFAIDPRSGSFGWASNYGSRSQAESSAIRWCESSGVICELLMVNNELVGKHLLRGGRSIEDSESASVSPERAKGLAAEFLNAPFWQPPRRATDILDLIDVYKKESPAELSSLLNAVNSIISESSNPGEAAKQYFRRGFAAYQLGRISSAITDLRAAADSAKQANNDELRLKSLWHLALATVDGGNNAQGIDILRQIPEEAARKGWHLSAHAYLTEVYGWAGDFARAEKEFETTFGLYNKSNEWAPSPDYKVLYEVWVTVAEAVLLESKGLWRESEVYHRKSIALLEKNPRWGNPNHWLAWRYILLGENLMAQGRLVEAELEARRGLLRMLDQGGYLSANTAYSLRALAEIYLRSKRFEEAEALARYAADLYHSVGAERHSIYVALTRLVLANSYLLQEQWFDAANEFDEIRKDMKPDEWTFGHQLADNLDWAIALIMTGRVLEADPIIEKNLVRSTEIFGKGHYYVAEAESIRALAMEVEGDRKSALRLLQSSVPVLIDGAWNTPARSAIDPGREFRLRLILEKYIALLSDPKLVGLAREQAIEAGFAAATMLEQHAAQRSIIAHAIRSGVDDEDLSEIVRREQDTQFQLSSIMNLLSREISRTPTERNARVIADLQQRLESLRAAHESILAEIESRYPSYAALTTPQPMTLSQVRQSLRIGDSLILIHVSTDRTYVWAVPSQGEVAFAVVPLSREDIKRKVNHLRIALDPQAATLGEIPSFDVGLAWELYQTLLEPVESGFGQSKHLLIVADGPLGQIPFSLFVDRETELGAERGALFSRYRNVPWLARSYTVTTFPAVSSLVTLLGAFTRDQSRKAFAGFGDPLFSTEQVAQARDESEPQGQELVSRRITAPGSFSLDRRSKPETRKLDSAGLARLPRLPETAEEIRSIAIALGADPEADVFLGDRASEKAVKTIDLSDRRVIAFATHGLVAGDLDGLDQPALALSSPEIVGDDEDGLLTLGEILTLELNANWVVLSACNTAAADGAGAEAVSGLGRAFFYAGTRALLVSNWPVETTSAKALTTDLFHRQGQDSSLSRAEALRQSMLNLIDGPGYVDEEGRTVFSYAHPIFWAPFSLVGDGGGESKQLVGGEER